MGSGGASPETTAPPAEQIYAVATADVSALTLPLSVFRRCAQCRPSPPARPSPKFGDQRGSPEASLAPLCLCVRRRHWTRLRPNCRRSRMTLGAPRCCRCAFGCSAQMWISREQVTRRPRRQGRCTRMVSIWVSVSVFLVIPGYVKCVRRQCCDCAGRCYRPTGADDSPHNKSTETC